MSMQVILWLATAGGALVFFAAGVLLGRRRIQVQKVIEKVVEKAVEKVVEKGPVLTPAPASAPTAAASDRLAAVQTEAEHLRGEITRTRAENERLDRDLRQLRMDMDEQAASVAATRGELQVAREATRALEADRVRQEGELAKLRAVESDLRAAVGRSKGEEGELHAHRTKVRELEKALEELRLERTRNSEREFELEKQIAAQQAWPELEKTLRHDLVVARESLRVQEEKTQRLDEINLGLRRELDALSGRATRLEALERENQELRVRSLASEVSRAKTNGHLPPARLGGGASTHALQTLVGQVASLEPVRAAVIGDDLGLVVASQGTHGDELAAIGALFGRACGEARKVLPLDQITRIIIEDEGRISVTVRPLRSYDGNSSADELTLVTLAHGAEPDPSQVARILGQQGSPPARDAHDAQQLGT